MTSQLLFCTSDKVTPELVRELQGADKQNPTANAYAPARASASEQHEPSRTVVDDHVDVFANRTDAELRELLAERRKPQSDDDRNWLHGSSFVVLDERSAEDKTVVVHALVADFADTLEGESDIDIEVIGEHWETWRIEMPECWNFLAILDFTTEIEEEIFRKRRRMFTNANGVFDVKSALVWREKPRNGMDYDVPKLA